MFNFQPIELLSMSVAIQQQGSVFMAMVHMLILPLENICSGASLVSEADWNHMDVQKLSRAGPPHP